MTFRRRSSCSPRGAVAAAIALAAVITYVVVRQDLRGERRRLAAQAAAEGHVRQPGTARRAGGRRHPAERHGGRRPWSSRPSCRRPAFGDASAWRRRRCPTATSSAPRRSALPTDAAGARWPRASAASRCATDRPRRRTLRVLTTRGPDGATLQIAKSLTEVDDTLGRLRWILLAVTLGGVGVASGARRRRLARGHASARPADRHRRAGHRDGRAAPPDRARRRRRARAPGGAPSTRCSARWSPRATPSASSWPTPRTSCARR